MLRKQIADHVIVLLAFVVVLAAFTAIALVVDVQSATGALKDVVIVLAGGILTIAGLRASSR